MSCLNPAAYSNFLFVFGSLVSFLWVSCTCVLYEIYGIRYD